jgi:hypothetical protein
MTELSADFYCVKQTRLGNFYATSLAQHKKESCCVGTRMDQIDGAVSVYFSCAGIADVLSRMVLLAADRVSGIRAIEQRLFGRTEVCLRLIWQMGCKRIFHIGWLGRAVLILVLRHVRVAVRGALSSALEFKGERRLARQQLWPFLLPAAAAHAAAPCRLWSAAARR